MEKTLAWLMNNFRVGKKIWMTNDTEVSRTLGGVAYALQTDVEFGKYDSPTSIFGRYRSTRGAVEEMLKGVKHPDFFKTACDAVMSTVESGIIYKRKNKKGYTGLELHHNRKNDYSYVNVSSCLNMYGPRIFLSEKKLKAYLLSCCLDASSKILDITVHDEDCDRLDEALGDMSHDWEDDGCENDLQNADCIEKRDYGVDYVFEKEKLLHNSAMAKSIAKTGRTVKGVLTTEEMQAKVDAGQTITCIRDDNIFLFSDDYCMGVNYLPKCFVPSSTVIPHNVAPREAFPDGVIKNVQDYILLYEKDKKQMNTVDEFIDYLNATYSRATVTA